MNVLPERLHVENLFGATIRRRGWFLEHISLRKLINMTVGVTQFAAKSEKLFAWPVVLKIDISPLCNLKCTVCVHAHPNGNEALEKQAFHKGQRMTVGQYRRIIDEIKGKSTAVSLYWLGDPLMHPDLDEMCHIAHDAGLNVHINTHLSFSLTDDRVRRMVKSGLTHLTVCVDGLSQEKYQLTRVGGRIDRVLSNLKRVCDFRREYGQVYPKVEVQYIKFQHNLDEFEKAKRLFQEIGVDQVTAFWGYLHNYTDLDPGTYAVHGPKKKKLLPQCFWPYFSMVIKYNGDVLPCCDYRIGSAYASTGDPWVVGNVFETSIRQVWNSPKYRQSRRLVSNPELVESEPWLKENFCYGCRKIFETDVEKNLRSGSHYRFEELYTIGEKGTPVRIPESEIRATFLNRQGNRSESGLPANFIQNPNLSLTVL